MNVDARARYSRCSRARGCGTIEVHAVAAGSGTDERTCRLTAQRALYVCIRFVAVLISLLVVINAARADSPSIHLEDMDKSVQACTDFYQYANGSWRAKNPIPPSMSRWSRRWQAGEEAKTQLKDILDSVLQRHDWPHGSAE